MNTVRISRVASCLIGLLLCLTASTATFAAIGVPGSTPIQGTIQNIDYVHHAITVNGQTYAVAGNAQFTGIGGFAVLHIGMPIAFTLGSSPSVDAKPGSAPATQSASSPPVITHITWLPD